ncbi:MAG: DUF2905 domain-containing protein [bacterium]|nr:DUF2905 domain-containing protein [bacterium]
MSAHLVAKLLILTGIGLVIIGILVYFSEKIPIGKWFHIGKLPGDIYIQKKNFTFYFPITSCIVISVILTFLMWILFRK